MSRRVDGTSSGVLHWHLFKNMTHFNFNAYILWLLKTLDLSCKQFDLNNTVCRRSDQRSSPVGVLPEEEEESVVLELLHKDEHNFPSLGASPQTVQPLQTHLPSIVCDESWYSGRSNVWEGLRAWTITTNVLFLIMYIHKWRHLLRKSISVIVHWLDIQFTLIFSHVPLFI